MTNGTNSNGSRFYLTVIAILVTLMIAMSGYMFGSTRVGAVTSDMNTLKERVITNEIRVENTAAAVTEIKTKIDEMYKVVIEIRQERNVSDDR